MSWKQMSLQAEKEREAERRSALQRRLRDLQVETRGQSEADAPCCWLFAGEFKDLGSLLTVGSAWTLPLNVQNN